jgi:16S rRNA (guanine527-N7)-methyltransferase
VATVREKLEAWAAQLGVSLEPAQWEKLQLYSALVLEHNAKTNITAAADADDIADRHLADGLAAVPTLKRCLEGVAAPQIGDVGSGGGFIGIAIQIAWPQCRVSLVESVHRKFLFLNWATVQLGLPARAVWARADKTPAHALRIGMKEPFDAAVERALAPLDEAVGVCVPLLKPGGFFAAYSSDGVVSDKAKIKLSRLSAASYFDDSYRLPGETQDRKLLVFRKS